MRFSVSATTRAPRTNEEDGVDYYFLSDKEFRARLGAGEFVEHEEVYPGLLYGTLRSELEKGGPDAPVLLDIDVRGAVSVKTALGQDACVIYIKPPSIDELLARLATRATDSASDVEARKARYRFETGFENRFDYIVLNDDLDTAVAETIDIVHAFLLATNENHAS